MVFSKIFSNNFWNWIFFENKQNTSFKWKYSIIHRNRRRILCPFSVYIESEQENWKLFEIFKFGMSTKQFATIYQTRIERGNFIFVQHLHITWQYWSKMFSQRETNFAFSYHVVTGQQLPMIDSNARELVIWKKKWIAYWLLMKILFKSMSQIRIAEHITYCSLLSMYGKQSGSSVKI